MKVYYRRIITAPKALASGYDENLESVIKRYDKPIDNSKPDNSLANEAVRDNLFFLEGNFLKYCKKLDGILSMLDVGCGCGGYSRLLARQDSPLKHVKYYGCEINKDIVKLCKKFNPGYNFFVSYAENINSADRSYDLMLYSGVIEYSLGKWKQVLLEMKRVSKKYVFITRMPVTKYNKTFYVHQMVVDTETDPETTNNLYFVVVNREALEKYFRKLGFRILTWDYTSEEYNIPNVNEKIISIQYLLEKIEV